MELTEPLEAAVVAVAHRAELAMPKRTSLPSMLPPDCSALAVWSTPCLARACAVLLGHARRPPAAARRSPSSPPAAPSPGACRRPSRRRCSTARPEISRIDSSSRKFESGVGFSKGWAELTLKKPPPLVPSCLIAICEAAGPTAMHLLGQRRLLGLGLALLVEHGLAVLVGHRLVVLGRLDHGDRRVRAEGLHDALRHQDQRQHERQRQQDVERASGSGRPRSCRWSGRSGARTRGSAPPARPCRPPLRRSSARSGRASGSDSSSSSRRRSPASWCCVAKLTAVLNDESGVTAPEALRVQRQDALQPLEQRRPRAGRARLKSEHRARRSVFQPISSFGPHAGQRDR